MRPPAGGESVHDISRLLWNFGSWLVQEDAFSDTIISTRVRLARNLQGCRFPSRASESESKNVIKKVQNACAEATSFQDVSYVEIDQLSEWDCKYYVERRLASPQLIESDVPALLVVEAGETLSVMVNEEDHLRVQCIVAGLGVDDAWALVSRADDELEENLNFSYSKEYGYLTACPTNLGTGLRVSVFVHLPALSFRREVSAVIKGLPSQEIAVRGFYGEGTEPVGDIYQISNQLTLGRTEDSVIERIYLTAKQIVELERQARTRVEDDDFIKLEDTVYRAIGILQNARLMSSLEAMNLLSTVKLGIEVGLIKGLGRVAINQLMMLLQPAHLLKIYGEDLSEEERDIVRAEFIRQNIKRI